MSIMKTANWYKNDNSQFIALISMRRFRMFTHIYAASFTMKTCFNESSNVYYLKH